MNTNKDHSKQEMGILYSKTAGPEPPNDPHKIVMTC